MTPQDIVGTLNQLEEKWGAKIVRDGCKAYLRKKTIAGLLPTQRKHIPRHWIEKAYIQQKGDCSICGEALNIQEAVGDHKIPLTKGGEHTWRNIGAAHRNCNASKNADDLITTAKKQSRNLMDLI